jgi:DNA polymerase-3 subunit epsilon
MQPVFADVVDEFLEFVEGSELVIHNAEFDIGFINSELERLNARVADIRDICEVRDTLALARRMHPGQRNSLDALARRYMVDNSMRELHGALLDARILAEVYLVMTGGQTSLMLDTASGTSDEPGAPAATLDRAGLDLVVVAASGAELDAHDAMLERMRKASGRAPIWDEIAAREAEIAARGPEIAARDVAIVSRGADAPF